MSNGTICVVGTDTRQEYLAAYLTEQGFLVKRQKQFAPRELLEVNLLIGPVSFYNGGKLLPGVEAVCKKKGITVFNYMACEEFLLRNTQLTAEGFLSLFIQNTPFCLEEANVLLLGTGRCGKAIHRLLGQFSCFIGAFDKVPKKIDDAGSYNVVINTIPAPVITGKHLQSLNRNCILFEIATAPGGFDREAVCELGLTLIDCPGIPGKLSPQSAGYAIGQCAISRLNLKGENYGI